MIKDIAAATFQRYEDVKVNFRQHEVEKHGGAQDTRCDICGYFINRLNANREFSRIADEAVTRLIIR